MTALISERQERHG